MLLLSDLGLGYIDGPIGKSSFLFLKGLSQSNRDVSLIDSAMLRIGWPKMLAVRRQEKEVWSFRRALRTTNRNGGGVDIMR